MGLRNFLISLPTRSGTAAPESNNVESVAAQTDVFTNVGTAPTLPPTVSITYDDGSSEVVGVSWSGSTDEVGFYTLEGLLLIASPNTNNSNIKASINVIVDNVESALTDWLEFNGFDNYVKYGDILDTYFAAASAYFELEFTMKDVPLTGIHRFFVKTDPVGNQRSFIFGKNGADIQFYWSVLGTSARQRQVQWAGALADTNEHTIKLVYNGSTSTNDGLDRCSLYIDGVLITASKTVSLTTGVIGDIFNGTARLSFGTDVNAAGAVSTATTIWFRGKAKDFVIRSSGGTVRFNGLDTPLAAAESKGTYKKYMQPILTGTKNASAQDNVQCTVNSVCIVDIAGTEYIYLYYLGANPTVNSDRDETCLAIKPYDNDITSGWAKELSGGLPQVVFGVGAVGKFDAKQVWLRNVMQLPDTTFIGFQLGQSATDTFGIGFNTSADGKAWTRQNSGDAIYTDGADITCFIILWDDDDSKYKMIYAGGRLGEVISYAESTVTTFGAQPVFTKIYTSILFGESLAWPMEFKKIDGVFYVWFSKSLLTFSGISDQIAVYSTTDFLTWEFIGAQIEKSGSSYFGHTATMGVIQLPNGVWVSLFTAYKNQIGKSANLGEEFTCIMAAELNRDDVPFASRVQKDVYPDYVVEHYPLNRESNNSTDILESVSSTYAAAINSTPVYTPDAAYGNRTLGFIDLNGSQAITNSTAIDIDALDFANFAIKLRVEIVTTGTHELFKIGDASSNRSIIITLESGKLRVRISADGTTWAKDWVTTVNISKPTGMSYIDNHIYVGVIFAGGTMTLYNDFVAFTAGQLTKTTDAAITTMFYTNGARVIGNNATLEMRSVSILSGATSSEFIDLEI